jgi:predicted RNA-binding Zn ribbon-like protein
MQYAGVIGARYDIPKAAPEPLRLVQSFVNTVDLQHGREWLGTPAELSAWLVDAGLSGALELTASDLQRAIELREALRALLRANNGDAVAAEAIVTVNRAASAGRLAVELDDGPRVQLEPYGRGIDGALGAIVGVALTAVIDGSWTRLKACPNCRWAFHDYSRNRSARWCSMQLCGNRLKTGDYRRRRRGKPPG